MEVDDCDFSFPFVGVSAAEASFFAGVAAVLILIDDEEAGADSREWGVLADTVLFRVRGPSGFVGLPVLKLGVIDEIVLANILGLAFDDSNGDFAGVAADGDDVAGVAAADGDHFGVGFGRGRSVGLLADVGFAAEGDGADVLLAA